MGKKNKKKTVDWNDITKLRETTITAIQKPHEELINVRKDYGYIIETDKELVDTYNGLHNTYVDQLSKAEEITKEHSSVVPDGKGGTKLDFEKGTFDPNKDTDQYLKYISIMGKYSTLIESVEHTATVGTINFLGAIDRTNRKLLQKQYNLTDEQVKVIEEEEKQRENNIEEFKNTYNGDTLKDDYPKALSTAAKNSTQREHSDEDVNSITAGFQKKLDGLTTEDIDKGGGITTVDELKKEGNK